MDDRIGKRKIMDEDLKNQILKNLDDFINQPVKCELPTLFLSIGQTSWLLGRKLTIEEYEYIAKYIMFNGVTKNMPTIIAKNNHKTLFDKDHADAVKLVKALNGRPVIFTDIDENCKYFTLDYKNFIKENK